MGFRAITECARVPWVPALVVWAICLLPTMGSGAPLAEIQRLPEAQQQPIATLFAELASQNLPSAALSQKLNEGLAKGVPAERLLTVLQRMADDAKWLQQQTAACACAKKTEAKTLLFGIGADALLGALSRTDLALGLQTICPLADGATRLATGFELFAYLTERLRAKPALAWRFALATFSRPETKAAYNPLVVALQEVFKARGSIDTALIVATTRLESGATARAIASLLTEQFLRR